MKAVEQECLACPCRKREGSGLFLVESFCQFCFPSHTTSRGLHCLDFDS